MRIIKFQKCDYTLQQNYIIKIPNIFYTNKKVCFYGIIIFNAEQRSIGAF